MHTRLCPPPALSTSRHTCPAHVLPMPCGPRLCSCPCSCPLCHCPCPCCATVPAHVVPLSLPMSCHCPCPCRATVPACVHVRVLLQLHPRYTSCCLCPSPVLSVSQPPGLPAVSHVLAHVCAHVHTRVTP